jgi:hypothetical protein
MATTISFLAALASGILAVSGMDYSTNSTKICTLAGERCAGAEGKQYVQYAPCCDSTLWYIQKPSATADEWGAFCMPPTDKKMCYATGQRCKGAAGDPYVQFMSCCSLDDECVEDALLGWGSFCTSKAKTSPPTTTTEKCYMTGERCMGAPGFPYIPYQKCCNEQDECVEDSSSGWGSFCKPSQAHAPVGAEYVNSTISAPTTVYATTSVQYTLSSTIGIPSSTSLSNTNPTAPTTTSSGSYGTSHDDVTTYNSVQSDPNYSSYTYRSTTSVPSSTTACLKGSSTTVMDPNSGEYHTPGTMKDYETTHGTQYSTTGTKPPPTASFYSVPTAASSTVGTSMAYSVPTSTASTVGTSMAYSVPTSAASTVGTSIAFNTSMSTTTVPAYTFPSPQSAF